MDLRKAFPGIKGFSVANLWYMRLFYINYKDNEKLQPQVGEISWAKNILIITKCKDNFEREFYITATKKFGWTKNMVRKDLMHMYYWLNHAMIYLIHG